MKKPVQYGPLLLKIMKISAIQVALLLMCSGVTLAFDSNAQEFLNQPVTITVENARLSSVLRSIEQKTDVRFVYSSKGIGADRKVSIAVTGQRLADLLQRVLTPLEISYRVVEGQITLTRSSQSAPQPDKASSQVPETDPVTAVADIVVTGKVTDGETGVGLPGVSVVLKGTTKGTTTDASGTFRLSIPDGNSTLTFSFVGYASQDIAVGNRTTINLTLLPDKKSLDEVVVVGYGTVKKSDLTGSLSQVKSKEINAFPAANVLQALSGRAAGVQVLQNTGAPGGAVSVRIRGTNSIQGSNEPLYVIDGFPTAGTNPTILNNADIETIEVLKDASATAIYGSRGANGVVLITTKRGKAGKTQVDYEGSFSVQTLRKKLDLLNASEYIKFYNEQAANDKVTTPYFTPDQISAAGQGGYDWQGSIFQKAPIQSHALTVSGGNEKTQFSISGSVFGQQGIIRSSDYNRYSLRTNINHQISSKFSLSLSSTLSRINTSRQNSSGNNRGNSLISSVLSLAPILNPYDADGHYTDFTTILPWAYFPLNPLYTINETTDKVRANRILTNVAVTYKPLPELAIRISGGVENSDDRNDTFSNRVYNKNNSGSNSAGIFTTQANSLLSENTITYTKTVGKHSLSALVGATYQNFLTRTLNASGQNFISNTIETGDIGSAGTVGVPASSYSYATLLSYLGRINYNFGDRYLATVSFRSDGSSRYSEGNKRGYFPSAALAWRVSNEAFMKQVPAISDLKLRVGYGLTGSQAINPYTTLTQLAAGKTVFDDALYTYYAPSTTLPGQLKWGNDRANRLRPGFRCPAKPDSVHGGLLH